MKKLTLLAGAAMILAPAAFAAPGNGIKTAEPTEIACAVLTDHKVNIKEATKNKLYADFKGNRYFFCCSDCPKVFNKDPEKYAKNDHITTPKSD